jgi:hypothetical protein
MIFYFVVGKPYEKTRHASIKLHSAVKMLRKIKFYDTGNNERNINVK